MKNRKITNEITEYEILFCGIFLVLWAFSLQEEKFRIGNHTVLLFFNLKRDVPTHANSGNLFHLSYSFV